MSGEDRHYRHPIRRGEVLWLNIFDTANVPVFASASVEYLDGTYERLTVYGSANGTTGLLAQATSNAAKQDGHVVGLMVHVADGASSRSGQTYVQAFIGNSSSPTTFWDVLAEGFVYSVNTAAHDLVLDEYTQPCDPKMWYTWVFQGTVAEDATAGTHVCTLTVTPGAGNEMQVLYGLITSGGAGGSADVFVDDGTNVLTKIVTTSSLLSQTLVFPGGATNATANVGIIASGTSGPIVSGTMRLILRISTATVSLTQTFAVVCRVRGPKPTATLADTVGTPTLTTNTNTVF